MPYVERICSQCDKKQTRYHNVHKCGKCGAVGKLVTVTRFCITGLASARKENAVLRGEVNALRSRLGIGVKYREWDGGPKT